MVPILLQDYSKHLNNHGSRHEKELAYLIDHGLVPLEKIAGYYYNGRLGWARTQKYIDQKVAAAEEDGG